MKNSNILFLILISVLLNSKADAQNPTQLQVEVLSKSSTSWDGENLPNYPKGEPEITITKITIPVGFQLPVHKHSIPLGGYIVSGELTVVKNDSIYHKVKAGETLIELVNTWHYGKNEGAEPVVIIVFYLGIKDKPLSINKQN